MHFGLFVCLSVHSKTIAPIDLLYPRSYGSGIKTLLNAMDSAVGSEQRKIVLLCRLTDAV